MKQFLVVWDCQRRVFRRESTPQHGSDSEDEDSGEAPWPALTVRAVGSGEIASETQTERVPQQII
jgi:hypothetical protein